MTSPREGVTVFTSPYLSAGAPALGEAKGLIQNIYINFINILYNYKSIIKIKIIFNNSYYNFLIIKNFIEKKYEFNRY